MERKELLELIEQARREEWTQLYLFGKGLNELPPEIGELTHLTWLDLSYNRLTVLPPEIGELTHLTFINLFNNQLEALPPEIVQLIRLTELNLSENQLEALPPEIVQLSNLTILNLSENQLEALPPEIMQLSNLTKLYLSNNELTALPPEIVQLIRLTELNLSNNQLEALPPEIGQLTHLTFSFNQLTTLPPEIGQLTHLTWLDLSNNQLEALPPEIGQLTSLTGLNLSNNQLGALPPEIAQLTHLSALFLGDNQLTALPFGMERLKNLTRLELGGNEALGIPPEILQNWDAPVDVLRYYYENAAGLAQPLNEAKVLIVGEEEVGKTSLVRQLLDHLPADPHEDTTRGIEIRRWARSIDGDEIKLNVWDFGGQEIMHATHQFFLTERSVYLVAIAGRKRERLDYWLRMVEIYGGSSPVIVVANKADQYRPDLKNEDLRGYPLVYTSCTTGEGIEELRQAIDEAIRGMPHVRDLLPRTWFSVKERLEEIDQDFIRYEDYRDVCRKAGVESTEDQRLLLRFLHDLGCVLHFEGSWSSLPLQDTTVLNPHWVTQGVYRILNDEPLRQQKDGRLHVDSLRDILDATAYPVAMYPFLIRVMERFELCFPLDEEGWYLIPDLLPVNAPVSAREFGDGLRFEFQYDVLPASILLRLMVRLHKYIVPDWMWREGMVIEYEENQALIRADAARCRIAITIRGRESTQTNLRAVIRAVLGGIHSRFMSLHPREDIAVPGHPDRTVAYEWLRELRRKGKTTFPLEGVDDDIDIRWVLSQYEPTSDAWHHTEIHYHGDRYEIGDIHDSHGIGIGRGASTRVGE